MSDEEDEDVSTPTVRQTTRKRLGAVMASDDLVQRLMNVLDQRFESIERRLDGLLPRAEHETAVHDLKNRIQTLNLDVADNKRWRETLPSKMVSEDRFAALSDDVRELKHRPAEARAWFEMFSQGGGCLYMIVALVVAVVMQLMTIGISVGVAFLIR